MDADPYWLLERQERWLRSSERGESQGAAVGNSKETAERDEALEGMR